jgi:hypothetical protein
MRILERDAREAEPRVEHVHVAVAEARHRAAALEIDHLRRRSDERLHVLLAHREDARVPDGDGVGLRTLRVPGPDAAVKQHQLGGDGEHHHRHGRQRSSHGA